MISTFAVPQFGQVIVDSRITGTPSRIHVSKHDQDRAEGQEAHDENGGSRPTARNAGRASANTTTPDKQPASTHETYDGRAQQRESVWRGDPCHGGQPCTAEAERAQQQGKAATRRRAECSGKTTGRE